MPKVENPTDLILQTPTEKLLKRMETGRTALKKRFEIKKQETCRRDLEIRREKNLHRLQNNFMSLLSDLARKNHINPSSLPMDEFLALPDLIAETAMPLVVVQRVAGITAATTATALALLPFAVFPVGMAIATLAFGIVLGILATFLISIAIDMPRNRQPFQWLTDIFNPRNSGSLKSLRYVYYYRRLRKILGPQKYLEYLEKNK